MISHNPLYPHQQPPLGNNSAPSVSSSSESFSPIFKILQLNCHNSFEVTSNALNSDSNFSILVLQEPWINPHTLKLPHYSNWTCVLDANHSPADYNNKHRTCFFFDKSFSSAEIQLLGGGSRLLSAIDRMVESP